MDQDNTPDYLATQETDGDFFNDLFAMEREILTEMGDQEGLAVLDKLAREAAEADEGEDDQAG